MNLEPDELVIDLFAGGGGASEGILMAIGRDPDIGMNHDPEACVMHAANHPGTKHLCGDAHHYSPREVTQGRRVGFLWASPDCTHHSKARGGRPFRDKRKAARRRGLASVVVRWAREVRPRVIALENVEEFQDWGPLGRDGKPDVVKRGLTFRRWVGQLRAAGYAVEWRELRACDYGAPTIRKRLFVIARCDGLPIVWPTPTHGPGRPLPHRTAAECIDWSRPCPSIFRRKKPLTDKTLARIARGVELFVLDSAQPFLVPTTHKGDLRVHDIGDPMRTVTGAHRGEHAVVSPILTRTDMLKSNALCAFDARDPLRTATTSNGHAIACATLIHSGNGERVGQAPRVYDLERPLSTVMAEGQKHAMVSAFLAKHNDGHASPGSGCDEPLHTVTTTGQVGPVAATLVPLRGGGPRGGRSLRAPMPTITAQGMHIAEVRALLAEHRPPPKAPRAGETLSLFPDTSEARRLGLVTIAGTTYQVVDIGLRMLQPRELFNAQGFRPDYVIDIKLSDETIAEIEAYQRRHGLKVRRRRSNWLTKESQIRMCGNSVCPPLAAAIVRSNVARPVEMAA